MPKSNTYSTDLLKLLFQAVAITGIAQNNASPNASVFAALHTATPGVAGTQTTSEAAYPSYARVTLARTAGVWPLTGQNINPASPITFPASTGAPSETETFFSIGELVTTGGKIFYFGAIAPTITVNAAGITPQLTTATSITEA
jgi:hypothetical protein